MLTLILAFVALTTVQAQERIAQHKPYIDLRPLHFGILVGMNVQDIELRNVGPQTMTLADGTTTENLILCDADNWNPGFSVGVLADLRLNSHFSLRFSPAMHFGAKHLVFRNMNDLTETGLPRESTQDLKNTYISVPVDLKFSAERFNNYRPYVMGGVNAMMNLSGKDQDFVQLKRYDTFVEIGLGCDFYLPFFKLIPELKFCYSLTDTLDKSHADELRDVNKLAFARSVDRAQSKMIVLTFYFE